MSEHSLTTRWQQLSEPVIRRLQAEKLRHYLRQVVLPFSAHYRQLFEVQGLKVDDFHTLEDLDHLPFTRKADLLATADKPQRYRDFLLIPDEKVLRQRPSTLLHALLRGRAAVRQEFESEFRPIFVTFTTGRSAEPTPFFYSQRDLTHLATAGRRLAEICGGRPEFKMLNTFPFAPHLAFWLAHYTGTAGGIMTLSSGGGKVAGTEGNLRQIRKLKPEVIIGMPTFVYHLFHQAAEEGMRCEHLCSVVLGGEKISEGMRQKLRNLAKELGVPNLHIVATYGFTEAKQAWPECPFPHDHQSGGYHLYPDLGILEVIDPQTGKTSPPGKPGEIVFTPLDARGSVVLRYRTGDFTDGGLTYEPCPHCGRCLPRLLGNISRRSEIKQVNFDKIKGTLVDFNELEHVLDNAPHIGAWQVELRKVNDDPMELDELILHVQKINGADEDRLVRDLGERCFARIEVHPNRIQFHNGEEIRRLQGVGVALKEQKLVDHRPQLQTQPLTPPALK